MFCVRLAAVSGLAAGLTMPLRAQVPHRPHEEQVASLPRIMVANPYVTAAADSAAAVQVGAGMRDRFGKIVEGDYNLLSAQQMNDALKEYGFPPNAVLSPSQAITLAKSVQARMLVSGTMNRLNNGQYAVQARFAGPSDEVGSVVNGQQGRASLVEFGDRVAQQLQPAYKAYDNAKNCMTQQESRPDKAAEAANKALRDDPRNGLAEFCLALIAQKKSDRKEALRRFQAAAKDDPTSLAAWQNLAGIYQAQNDTAGVLASLRELLRIAPTNQKLRETAFRYFLQANKFDIAKEIADSGIKDDPYNADFYDLKSNACAFLEDYRCAVEALKQEFRVDSAKADTLFYAKILAFSEQQLSDTTKNRATAADTAEFVRWAKAGSARFPKNVTLLQELGKAYVMTGQADSSVAVTQRLLQANPNDVTPALATAQTLIANNRQKDALPLIQVAITKGDAQAKEAAAGMLYQAAVPLVQGPGQDYAAAADLLRATVAAANPQGQVYPAANFLLGVATLLQVPQVDPQAEKQKSCDLAHKESDLLNESEQALTAGQSVNAEAAAKDLAIIGKYKPRVASMIKAYCK
ncbi:MAG TPA: hypothetical protein VFW66_15450 [Gemmatimonadales bacterium]|nr:hypothetical protein [Gemmatimonadales bacterium]